MVSDNAGAGRVVVAGGSKGNDGCNAGGDGAPGRVRIDLPSAAAAPSLVGPDAYRGPVLSPDTAVVVTDATLAVTVFGSAGTAYYVEREGCSRTMVTTGSDRLATWNVVLEPGPNRVCVAVSEIVSLSSFEGVNCISVAYMH